MTTPIIISDDASAEDVASIVAEQRAIAESDRAFQRILAGVPA